MPAALGLLAVAVLLTVIVSQRASPLVALIAVPVAAAIAGGFGFQTGAFIVKGIESIAPVAGAARRPTPPGDNSRPVSSIARNSRKYGAVG